MDPGKLALAVFNLMLITLAILHEIFKGFAMWKARKHPKTGQVKKGLLTGQLLLQKEVVGKKGIEQAEEEGKEDERKQQRIKRSRQQADVLDNATRSDQSDVERGEDGEAGESVDSGAIEGKQVGESSGEKTAEEQANIETRKPVELSDLLKTFEVRAKGKVFFIWHMIAMVGMLALGAAFVAVSSDSIKERAQVVPGTTVNIEGAALANVYYRSSDEWKVWDPTDIAEPALEHTVFFVTTRRVVTKNQTLRDDCLQSDVTCSNNTDCLSKYGERFRNSRGNGIFTGSCNNGYCSVRTWCPLEYNINDSAAHIETLNSPLNFDILIKSHLAVRYEYGPPFTRESVAKYEGADAEHCLYDEKNDPHCPRIKMSYIVDKITENNNDKYETLINNGGVISIRLDWRCRDTLDKCDLTYNFN